MNIKNTVTISDRHLRYAEQLVEDGQFPSVEKVVEAGLDELMRADELTPEQHNSVTAMADELRRRMDDPPERWIAWDGKNLADLIKAKLDEKHKAGK
jgi:antitoxin ParD1/3/4